MRIIDIGKRVEKVIIEVFQLGGQKIDKNWTSNDIQNWDSLGHLTLVIAIEKEFNMKFEVEDFFKIKSIKDIEELVKEKLKIQDS